MTQTGYLLSLFLWIFTWIIIVIGLVLFFVGWGTKERKLKITGLFLFAIPLSIALPKVVYDQIYEAHKHIPTRSELVGTYIVCETTENNASPSKYINTKLILHADSTYSVSNFNEIKSSGEYVFDDEDDSDEFLGQYCLGFENTFVNIVPEWDSYKIEFILGDPDSGEAVYFKKINN